MSLSAVSKQSNLNFTARAPRRSEWASHIVCVCVAPHPDPSFRVFVFLSLSFFFLQLNFTHDPVAWQKKKEPSGYLPPPQGDWSIAFRQRRSGEAHAARNPGSQTDTRGFY